MGSREGAKARRSDRAGVGENAQSHHPTLTLRAFAPSREQIRMLSSRER
jgi:hypothetical protein